MDCRFIESGKTDDGKRQVKCKHCGFTIATPTAVELIHRACDRVGPVEPSAEPKKANDK